MTNPNDSKLIFIDPPPTPEEVRAELERQIPLINETIRQFEKSQRITREILQMEITI